MICSSWFWLRLLSIGNYYYYYIWKITIIGYSCDCDVYYRYYCIRSCYYILYLINLYSYSYYLIKQHTASLIGSRSVRLNIESTLYPSLLLLKYNVKLFVWQHPL